MAIALGIEFWLSISQIDVESACANGTIEEEVFM